jgi:hypothetical protein
MTIHWMIFAEALAIPWSIFCESLFVVLRSLRSNGCRLEFLAEQLVVHWIILGEAVTIK